jgi:hypothetical protein
MKRDPTIRLLRYLQNGCFEDAEQCRILGVLGPANNLTPVVCISFFFPRSREYPHIIFGDTTEDEEEAGEDAGIRRHRHINCGGNLGGRKEPIREILMLGKFVNVCTSNVQSVSKSGDKVEHT